MFIDEVLVYVAAGTGGSGASSFARFKFRPKAGPDGGDGGHGGNVYIVGDSNLATLLDYRYHASWKAERGGHGKGKNMTGATSEDIHLPVPPGTEVWDEDSGDWLGEIRLWNAADGAQVALMPSNPPTPKGKRSGYRSRTHHLQKSEVPSWVDLVTTVRTPRAPSACPQHVLAFQTRL